MRAFARLLTFCLICTLAILITSCSQPAEDTPATGSTGGTAAPQTDLGTEDRPITMYFVPSMEAGKVVTSAEEILVALEERTGYLFEVEVPPSYIAVVEAMGAEPARADLAWLSTFAYVLAHDKHDAEVALQVGRYGQLEYQGMIVSRKDSGVNALEDIADKSVAFVDAASTSGHIYPKAMLDGPGIEPAAEVFAGGHPQTMLYVYTGRADVGCAYYNAPSETGELRDARKDLLDQYPDAGEVLQVIELTEEIPNDTVAFRKGFPESMRQEIVDALIDYMHTPDGAEVLKELYEITDLVPVEDEAYDGVRTKLAELGLAGEATLAALMDEKELPSEDAVDEEDPEETTES